MAFGERPEVYKVKMTQRVFFIFAIVASCWAQGCNANAVEPLAKSADADTVEKILQNLNRQCSMLESYQCRLEYRFSQPLLDSQSVRTGELYYLKSDGQSNLRIDFRTLQQDEGKTQDYMEQYIFDGLWLTVVDYQIKTVKRYELSEANNPLDALELARNNFPMIGFSSSEDIRKEFDIESVKEQEGDFWILHLKVKQDSVYKDNYKSAEFLIDKRVNLPAKVIAISTEGDIYELKFTQPKVNKRIDKKIFEIKIPNGFGKPEVIPLEKGRRK